MNVDMVTVFVKNPDGPLVLEMKGYETVKELRKRAMDVLHLPPIDGVNVYMDQLCLPAEDQLNAHQGLGDGTLYVRFGLPREILYEYATIVCACSGNTTITLGEGRTVPLWEYMEPVLDSLRPSRPIQRE
ncbi:hypothetical protein BDV33DRAFT_197284 [Aspergillus novoparasiticus]|uniref:Ubiquitin-like domain-containing protein n=1 Tax=Aspergillus novoparasiticus TaxID=986946 RepID=A0A5N6F8T5_9EURO|nr:hypothetical protein BDV33DRAFT_197284 [Aspergillus novoparasiticus]